jgi:hypothetical protein
LLPDIDEVAVVLTRILRLLDQLAQTNIRGIDQLSSLQLSLVSDPRICKKVLRIASK